MRSIIFIITALFLHAPFFVFAASPGDIVFSEIAYDLKGADDGHEWVELHNISSSDIDLTGWKFNDGSNHILNAPPKNGGQGAMIISAGGYAVLADDAAVFLADHSGFSGTVIDAVMSLGNTSATLTLFDNNGTTIDVVSYTKDWGATGNERTLERNSAGSWGESTQEGGTPGAGNGGIAAPQDAQQNTNGTTEAVISNAMPSPASIVADAGENVVALSGDEIMFDASGTKGATGATFVWNFGDGTVAQGETIFHRYLFPGKYIVMLSVSGYEDTVKATIYPRGVALSEFMMNDDAGEASWIEIRNDSPYSADLSGWGLGGTTAGKPDFIIPEGTALAAGEYLVFAEDNSGIVLAGEKGVISLWYPHGQEAMRVEYTFAKKGFSAARKSDGSYAWTDQRTPGARNVFIVSDDAGVEVPPVSVAGEDDDPTPTLRAAWQRVRDDAGSSVKSFIAPSAHAMVYDEGASVSPMMRAIAPAFAYGAFPFGIMSFIAGMAGGIVGMFFMRRKLQ